MVKITLDGTTIPHEVTGIFGAGSVLMKPAPEGTGIIAGGAVRAVMEAVGVSNIRSKSLRSNNPQNVVKACMQGLMSLRGLSNTLLLINFGFDLISDAVYLSASISHIHFHLF